MTEREAGYEEALRDVVNAAEERRQSGAPGWRHTWIGVKVIVRTLKQSPSRNNLA
jgi:hypothetical protein